MRRIVSGLVTFAVAGGALAMSASPVQAEAFAYPTSGWVIQDWSPEPGMSEGSFVTGKTSVMLRKPAGDIGTSIETSNLGLIAGADCQLSISYNLAEGASPTLSAIRMFWYDTPDANTATQAPSGFVAADSHNGQLTLDIPEGVTIGTFGLTYDASNNSVGKVHFKNLTMCGQKVSFKPALIQVEAPRPEVRRSIECGEPGSIQIPEIEGVLYQVNDNGWESLFPGGKLPYTNTVKIRAIPEDGYRLSGSALWIFKAHKAPKVYECVDYREPLVERATVCDVADILTVPADEDNVSYSVVLNGESVDLSETRTIVGPGEVTVVATAGHGYAFTGTNMKEWVFNNTLNGPVECSASPPPLSVTPSATPTATESPVQVVPVGQSTPGLPQTGSRLILITGFALLTLGVGVVLVLVSNWRRKKGAHE